MDDNNIEIMKNDQVKGWITTEKIFEKYMIRESQIYEIMYKYDVKIYDLQGRQKKYLDVETGEMLIGSGKHYLSVMTEHYTVSCIVGGMLKHDNWQRANPGLMENTNATINNIESMAFLHELTFDAAYKKEYPANVDVAPSPFIMFL
jgi:hypothetical protein